MRYGYVILAFKDINPTLQLPTWGYRSFGHLVFFLRLLNSLKMKIMSKLIYEQQCCNQ